MGLAGTIPTGVVLEAAAAGNPASLGTPLLRVFGINPEAQLRKAVYFDLARTSEWGMERA